ncbi:acylphosphatase [Elioraea tepida]|uniref:acylphosphatase n=1 Tax=Elioraea tepida TaxID=2843330 RepID=UPI002E2E19BC|nr:acylphosphatase [Elioraea tepida]
MIAARRFVVSGRVQGVGFRAFVVREACALGLAGWVRNLADGRVEALAEGDPAALAKLAEALGRGPLLARVDRVEGSEVPVKGLSGFRQVADG